MPFFASLIAAVIPMIIYLIFIWRLDKYEREPFIKVFSHFLWGAIGSIFFAIIFSTVLSSSTALFINSESALSLISTVLIAPFVEEIVKSSYLFRTYKKNYFDNITDGLVYGGAIGLGFGMTENLFYFITYNNSFSQWIYVVIIRSIFSAVMHAIATATVGAFLAKTKFTLSSQKNNFPIIGLILAMLFHATWNFSLTFEFTYLVGMVFMIFLIIGFLFVFNFSLKSERKLIYNELIEEENEILQRYHLKKDNLLNLPDRKKYMSFVTKLAFRKFQAKNSNVLIRENYLADVELYKQKINSLINKSSD
jgi:RsiW-degrading membrane proteinase PrsW (M82 family)